MRGNLLFMVVALPLAFAACTGSKQSAQAQASLNTTAKASTTDINYIRMHRTSCFGRCPDYIVELYADGRARYTGRNFTDYSGIYETKLDPSAIAGVFSEFATYRVDTCKDVYQQTITDLPGIIYDIEYATKSKKINNAHFGPPFLRSLADKIDEVVKVDESWTKVSDDAKGD